MHPDSPALDALLPAKSGDLKVAKLPAPSRLVIYLLDGEWFSHASGYVCGVMVESCFASALCNGLHDTLMVIDS